MDKKDIEQLLKRYRNGGPITPAEKRWLDSFYLHYAQRSKHHISDAELAENLATVEANMKKSVSPYRAPNNRVRFAAAATLLFGLLLLGYYLQTNYFQKTEMIQIAGGEMREIMLEDGSKITLNGSSKLIYPKSFEDAATREVTLIGEAYFDVAKDAEKPFLIHTPRMEIRVLGTAFNVRDYQEDQQAETSLIRGQVEVWKTGQEKEKFILKPKEKFVLENPPVEAMKAIREKNEPHTLPNVATNIRPIAISEKDGQSTETEWMIKRVTIMDESLAQIARRLERIYGVKITIKNQAVANQVYSATFDNEPVDDILQGLQAVAAFRYQKDTAGNISITTP
ncbi:FecR family protein [Sphingobacterium chungjuense]|uniref:FecR family protein n=1 Tax=Sphingobacterium chungjuense TaxID=2675553 RepID=UPI001407D76C|nr:FecR domain-containing protein [Sphingobacterium chungjuense]